MFLIIQTKSTFSFLVALNKNPLILIGSRNHTASPLQWQLILLCDTVCWINVSQTFLVHRTLQIVRSCGALYPPRYTDFLTISTFQYIFKITLQCSNHNNESYLLTSNTIVSQLCQWLFTTVTQIYQQTLNSETYKIRITIKTHFLT